MDTIKHFAYTLITLIVFAFGLTFLNQSVELNNVAVVLSLLVITFAGYLSYELITTKDYRMLPFLAFGAVIATLFAAMYRYGG
jgi:hypothetical protein